MAEKCLMCRRDEHHPDCPKLTGVGDRAWNAGYRSGYDGEDLVSGASPVFRLGYMLGVEDQKVGGKLLMRNDMDVEAALEWTPPKPFQS
jgi:hypothetical protein